MNPFWTPNSANITWHTMTPISWHPRAAWYPDWESLYFRVKSTLNFSELIMSCFHTQKCTNHWFVSIPEQNQKKLRITRVASAQNKRAVFQQSDKNQDIHFREQHSILELKPFQMRLWPVLKWSFLEQKFNVSFWKYQNKAVKYF